MLQSFAQCKGQGDTGKGKRISLRPELVGRGRRWARAGVGRAHSSEAGGTALGAEWALVGEVNSSGLQGGRGVSCQSCSVKDPKQLLENTSPSEPITSVPMWDLCASLESSVFLSRDYDIVSDVGSSVWLLGSAHGLSTVVERNKRMFFKFLHWWLVLNCGCSNAANYGGLDA